MPDRLRPELTALRDETLRLTERPAAELVGLDVGARRDAVNVVLLQVSELVRNQAPGRGLTRRGADLMGAKLAGQDLRGANLRGAC